MKILIIDDCHLDALELKKELKKYFPHALYEIKHHINKTLFLKHYDCIFVDVMLEEGNSIEIIENYHTFDTKIPLIITSSNEKHVHESLKILPFYYVRKRCLEKDIKTYVKLYERFFIEDEYIDITYKNHNLHLNKNDIVYIEVESHYLHIHIKDRIEEIRMSLKEFQDEYLDDSFIQIHKSYVINRYYIYEIYHDTIELLYDDISKQIPVGRLYKEKWFELI